MIRHHHYTVKQDEAGARLDRFIADKESELSRSRVQKLIYDGRVMVGGSKVKPRYNVQSGDVVRIELPAQQLDMQLRAEKIPLDVIFEDDDVMVVDKPAGMVVHPAAGVDSGTLVNAVLERLSPDLSSIAQERPGIVHRLDKGSSGVIVVARTVRAYHNLIDQFKEHTTKRKYAALFCGSPKQNSGFINAPIGRSQRDRKKMAVTSVRGKEAITHFSIIERYGEFSLAEITLETGRTHQIRVHLSHIGYPVVGDPIYGGRNRAIKTATSQEVRSALQDLSRQALHAQLLGFIHPRTGDYLEFAAPIPEDIQRVIDALNEDRGNQPRL